MYNLERLFLAMKESISGYRCERRNMVTNCEMFMNYNKTSYMLPETNMTAE